MTTDIRAVWAETVNIAGQLVTAHDADTEHPEDRPLWERDPAVEGAFHEAIRDRVLIMGRRTFEALPPIMKTTTRTASSPLIVLTRTNGPTIIEDHPGNWNIQPISPQPGGEVAHALTLAGRRFPGRGIAVIGGPQVIELFEPVLSELHVFQIISDDYTGTMPAPFKSNLTDPNAFTAVGYRSLPPDYRHVIRYYARSAK